jgi:hypothetical protein
MGEVGGDTKERTDDAAEHLGFSAGDGSQRPFSAGPRSPRAC